MLLRVNKLLVVKQNQRTSCEVIVSGEEAEGVEVMSADVYHRLLEGRKERERRRKLWVVDPEEMKGGGVLI